MLRIDGESGNAVSKRPGLNPVRPGVRTFVQSTRKSSCGEIQTTGVERAGILRVNRQQSKEISVLQTRVGRTPTDSSVRALEYSGTAVQLSGKRSVYRARVLWVDRQR